MTLSWPGHFERCQALRTTNELRIFCQLFALPSPGAIDDQALIAHEHNHGRSSKHAFQNVPLATTKSNDSDPCPSRQCVKAESTRNIRSASNHSMLTKRTAQAFTSPVCDLLSSRIAPRHPQGDCIAGRLATRNAGKNSCILVNVLAAADFTFASRMLNTKRTSRSSIYMNWHIPASLLVEFTNELIHFLNVLKVSGVCAAHGVSQHMSGLIWCNKAIAYISSTDNLQIPCRAHSGSCCA